MNERHMVAGPDMKVVFPGAGVIRIESVRLFAAPDDDLCQRFLQAVLLLPAIDGAIIAPMKTPCVDLCFDEGRHNRKNVLERLASLLSGETAQRRKRLVVSPSVTARDRH